MSVKSKLLQKINKDAQRIRERRVDAANNKTIEAAVFDFFKNAEDSRLLHGGNQYDHTLVSQARQALESRLRSFDFRVKVSVEYSVNEDPNSTEEQAIRGVTVWWSQTYIAKNNVDPSLYIDVSQMLFLNT